MSLSERLPEPIDADRVVLVRLRPGDAEEMVATLSSPELYVYIGGEPPALDSLQQRYAALADGRSPDGKDEWLNWIVRLKGDERGAIGTVQATVTHDGDRAEVAWVIGAKRQGQGYGSEAASAMVRALIDAGVSHVTAHVHPDHAASAAVARACGLTPTEELHDGERLWTWRADDRGD